jgi:hypothetical protein
MGSGGSTTKRRTFEETLENKRAKANEIERVRRNVETLQKELVRPAQEGSTAIQRVNHNTDNMLQATFVAKQQLNRGGGALTKPDLVAVLTFCKAAISQDSPEKIAENAAQLPVSDLIVAIRTIVFDPVKITQVTKSTIAVDC